ncbi:MAG: hypothetical protein ACFCU6_09505, partial [Balneolaceae bacterium]
IYSDVQLPSFDQARSEVKKYIDSIADYTKNRYPELPDEQKKKILHSWKRYMEAFGYGKEEVFFNLGK